MTYKYICYYKLHNLSVTIMWGRLYQSNGFHFVDEISKRLNDLAKASDILSIGFKTSSLVFRFIAQCAFLNILLVYILFLFLLVSQLIRISLILTLAIIFIILHQIWQQPFAIHVRLQTIYSKELSFCILLSKIQ